MRDLPRTPVSALLMTRLASEHGVPAADLLRGTGLTADGLADPQAEVTVSQELEIVGNLVDALDNRPGLGLEAGQHYHLTAYGVWSFMLISSPTPRSAVDLALRYVDLTSALCSIESREVDGELRFVLDPGDLPVRLRRFAVERDAAAIRTIQQEAFPDTLRLQRVAFAFPPPDGPAADAGVFADGGRRVLGVPAEYDAPSSMVVCDGTRLDDPMPQANEHTRAVAQAQCVELLQRRRARAGLAGRVRDILVARLADPPDADEVAALLHLSGRTFQRRLAEDGTSFRALLDEVRQELAEELLVTAGLPVSQVARRLGYVEVSSFSQAFRRWKGMGPRAYRSQAAR